MPIANVALSNTFNEFRTTSNEVITRVNEFEDGTGVINAASATFSGSVNANSLLVSSNVEVTQNIVSTGNVSELYLIGDGTFFMRRDLSSCAFFTLQSTCTSETSPSLTTLLPLMLLVIFSGYLVRTIRCLFFTVCIFLGVSFNASVWVAFERAVCAGGDEPHV